MYVCVISAIAGFIDDDDDELGNCRLVTYFFSSDYSREPIHKQCYRKSVEFKQKEKKSGNQVNRTESPKCGGIIFVIIGQMVDYYVIIMEWNFPIFSFSFLSRSVFLFFFSFR